jgi:hypothetical protein
MRMHWCLMIVLAVCAAQAAGAAEPECEQSASRIMPSPDGRWITHVQEEVCATATGAAAGITVILASASDPARSKRVFIMPVPRSRDDWPRIRWQGTDAMEVRVPNLSEPSAPEPQFEGVRISLAYCGDNPADRAQMAAWKTAVKQWQAEVTAWAQRRKQDASAAGPRPPRPEQPVLAPGRCID